MFSNHHFDLSKMRLANNQTSAPELTRCSSPSGSSSSSVSSSSESNNSSNTTASNLLKKKKRAPCKKKTLLPVDYQPSEFTVLCGRNRECFEAVGNRRFRALCNMHMEDYLKAPGKLEKSRIVTKIMKAIRQSCPIGAFVAFENGRWYEVSQRTAREKVGGYFRDGLPTAYKSSAKAKLARKRAEGTVPTTTAAAAAPAPVQPAAASAPWPAAPARVVSNTVRSNAVAEDVDIIDMSLLQDIAPVEMDTRGWNTMLFGAAANLNNVNNMNVNLFDANFMMNANNFVSNARNIANV